MPAGIEIRIAIEKPNARITSSALTFRLEIFLYALFKTPIDCTSFGFEKKLTHFHNDLIVLMPDEWSCPFFICPYRLFYDIQQFKAGEKEDFPALNRRVFEGGHYILRPSHEGVSKYKIIFQNYTQIYPQSKV